MWNKVEFKRVQRIWEGGGGGHIVIVKNKCKEWIKKMGTFN